MPRIVFALVLTLLVAGCSSYSRDLKEAIKLHSGACLDGNDGSCLVLSQLYQAQSQGRIAAAQNLNSSLQGGAIWATEQQRLNTYSGGYGRPFSCSFTSITGQQFCY